MQRRVQRKADSKVSGGTLRRTAEGASTPTRQNRACRGPGGCPHVSGAPAPRNLSPLELDSHTNKSLSGPAYDPDRLRA